jgi:hypothetical protein
MTRKNGKAFAPEQWPGPADDGGAHRALMIQFLTWVGDRPRSRGDVMDAWRSTCPRLTVWEDAVIDGLVQIDPASRVTVTERGRALLEGTVRPTT